MAKSELECIKKIQIIRSSLPRDISPRHSHVQPSPETSYSIVYHLPSTIPSIPSHFLIPPHPISPQLIPTIRLTQISFTSQSCAGERSWKNLNIGNLCLEQVWRVVNFVSSMWAVKVERNRERRIYSPFSGFHIGTN